jgi:hypothetical protein
MEARDTSIIGEPATQVAGIDAKFDYPGTPVLTDQLANILSTILTDADVYKKRFTAEILRDYNQYNGLLDDRDKMAWQSRMNVPKARTAVDISTARTVAALWSNDDFFDIYPYTKQDDALVEVAKKIVKWQFWKRGIRESVRTSIKDAMICGFGVMKVTFEAIAEIVSELQSGAPQESLRIRRGLRIDPILPTDFWIDHTGRNRFVIQRTKRTLSDLWAMAQPSIDPTTGMEVPPVYDPEVVKEITPGMSDQERESQASLIRRDTPHLAADQAVDVYEYWGDIYDPKNGVVLYKNVVCTFVGKGKTRIIRAPQKNPFKHGMAPFIVITPGLAPHQLYGWGLIRSVTLVQDGINKIFNLMMDKAALAVPQTIVYQNALKNPAQDFEGDVIKFAPGKVWVGKDPERPPVEIVEMSKGVEQSDVELFQILNQIYDTATGVNEFATGTQTSTNRKTRTEVEIRAGATQQIFNDVAQHIEENALSPLIKMVYLLTVQFEDQYQDTSLVRMFGDSEESLGILMSLQAMDPDSRWAAMFLDAEFRVNGVSLSITRQDRLNRITGFIQSLSVDPTMGMIIDKVELMREWVKDYDFPRDIVLPLGEALVQAAQMAQLQMMMQQMGLMPAGANKNNQAAANKAEAGNTAEGQANPETGQKQAEQEPSGPAGNPQ